MAQDDPLAVLDPLPEVVETPDPLATLDPVPASIMAPVQSLPPTSLGVLESFPSELDDDNAPTIGEILRGLPNPLNPFANARRGVDTLAKTTGIDMSGFNEGARDLGQSIQEGLTAPGPFTAGRADPRGLILGQAFDAMGQIGSSQLEMIGYPNPEGFTYNAARVIRDATRTPDDVLAGEEGIYKFTRALTQTGAFMFGGKGLGSLSKGGPKMQGAIAGWLGAAVGGQAGAEDARAHGATDDQIYIARQFNTAFGATEGLPLGAVFQRIDDGTGGFLSKHLKSKAGQIAGQGALGAIEEGLQEAGQTWGENWTARDLAQYDPGRSLSDNILEAAKIGGSVGFLISLLATAAGVRNRGLAEEKIKTDILDPLNLDSIDQITGPFTMLSDRYRQLQNDPAFIEYQRLLETQGVEDPNAFLEADLAREQAARRLSEEGSYLDENQRAQWQGNSQATAAGYFSKNRRSSGLHC